MNYTEAIKYIEDKNKLGIVPGLDSIKELLRRLGNPENKCKSLHIAGTNGKGSVFAFVESALIEAGYKIGRYISPTIFTYLERFQINKNYMMEETFAQIMDKVSEAINDMESEGYNSPTAFEIETAVAFLFFEEENCDYMLIECGMGGTLDATNVIASPEISVFAQISMDHMQFLGETLYEIAMNKSGIIKDNSICVTAPQNKTVEKVLADACDMHKTKLIIADEARVEIIDENYEFTSFKYKDEEYGIRLLGEHQITNAITAIEVLKKLKIRYDYIKKGLEITEWKGRLTKVCDKPLCFVDGAHNEAAWLALKNNVNKYFTNKQIIYIIGVLKDKEYQKMVDILCDTMEYAVTITPNTPRGLDKKILSEIIIEKGIKTDMADTPKEAVKKAVSYARGDYDNNVILVCGSLSFISDYMEKEIWKELTEF